VTRGRRLRKTQKRDKSKATAVSALARENLLPGGGGTTPGPARRKESKGPARRKRSRHLPKFREWPFIPGKGGEKTDRAGKGGKVSPILNVEEREKIMSLTW